MKAGIRRYPHKLYGLSIYHYPSKLTAFELSVKHRTLYVYWNVNR